MKTALWAGTAFALLCLLSVHPGLFPPCPLWMVWHVRCPGCGATRALAALLRGDLGAAWRQNQLFILALPAVAGWVCLGRLRGRFEWQREMGLAGTVLAAAFTVWRNL